MRSPNGRLIVRIRFGEDGRFRVGLRAGSCILDPESGSPFPAASALEVEVEPDAYSEVIVSFDTGIR